MFSSLGLVTRGLRFTERLPARARIPLSQTQQLRYASASADSRSFNRRPSYYVGNIPFSATEDDLFNVFSPFGKVGATKVIRDHNTGRSSGYGFVEMDVDEGKDILAEEIFLDKRPLMVKPGVKKERNIRDTEIDEQ
eukprot:TRINITY_DN12042_c0_g1_i1.p1 TRINITY_DN12042_c0_g1~~TRINITY_DN12042_c0_g1_i1.p1  ORF type:complete len:153 (-),score=30.56 TRINITY_DN12042_c0_g1_i1:55-465(-)